MNNILKFGLGLGISILAAWGNIVKRNAFLYKIIAEAITATVICGGAVAEGSVLSLQKPAVEETMSAEQMIDFCNTLLCEGQYDEVMDVVKKYSESYGYDDNCSYIVAKTKALEGNYSEAAGIYTRLANDKNFTKLVEDELEIIQKMESADLSYLAEIDFLESNGMKPEDYGYTEEYIKSMEEALAITDEDIAGLIIDNIEDQHDVKEYDEYVKLAKEITLIYGEYADGTYNLSEESQKKLNACAKDLKEVAEDHKELMQMPLLKDAGNLVALINEDYKDLAEGVNGNSGYEELLVVAELYMRGIVSEKNFSKEFTEGYAESFKPVAAQLERILKELEEDDTVTHLEYEEMVALKEAIKNAKGEEVLYAIKENLHNKVGSEDVATSEVELMISQIEHYCENYDLSKDSFDAAVETGKNSENYDYAEAMRQIDKIINSGEVQDIMYVGDYIEQAIEHALPHDSYGIISESAAKQETETPEEGEKQESFSQTMGNYVSQRKSSIAIGEIDASAFETVRASVVISGEYAENSKHLKEILSVYDCGIEITDFEIEKTVYSSLKTMLICDVSGSMSNCIGDLRDAVNHYVGNINKNESISIVTFSNGIEGNTGFTTDTDRLIRFSNSMYASGGTAIYNTLYRCLQDFDSYIDSNDIIILMTDGQDGSPRDAETIMREIGELTAAKGITVYTVGLGDVDTTYLSTLAESGNGKFVYVADSESLLSFYSMLQGQVNNQYTITYKAANTLMVNNRTLEVKIENEKVFDSKTYSLMTDTSSSGTGTVTGGNSGSGTGTGTTQGGSSVGGTGTAAGGNGTAAGGSSYEDLGIEDNPFVDSLTEKFENAGSGAESPEDTVLEVSTLKIYGLDIRAAYQTGENISANLGGVGFTKDARASMQLIQKTREGGLTITEKYDVPMTYVNESTYSVVLPASLECGMYDISVSVGDETAYLNSAFYLMSDGTTKTIKYGPYTFTATNTRRSGNKIILTGDVTMNGWLHFNQGISLEGDLESDSQIKVTDNYGSYVKFDKRTAKGLSKYFAQKSINFTMPALGTFKLYNDRNSKYDMKNYQVDAIKTDTLVIMDLLQYNAPVIHLYPNSIELEYKQGTSLLPFQDVIFTAANIDNPFAFKVENSATITGNQIGIVFKFEGEDKRDNYSAFNVFNAPVYLDMNELKVEIDTINHEYCFGGAVQIGLLDMGVGAEVSLKGFVPDRFLLTLDKDVDVMIGQVPVTFSEFGVGAEDIVTAIENKKFGNIILVGQLDVAVAKVTAYFPALKDYVGDMSIASIDDGTFKFRWNPFMISASADLKLFDNITVAKSSFEMGNIPYTNELLELNEADVVGFTASLTEGIMLDMDYCKVNVSGTGDLSGNSRFIGFQKNGTASLYIEWWLLDTKIEKSGDVLLGVYFTEEGDPQFTLILAYQGGIFNKNKKLYYYIDKNGDAYSVEKGKAKKFL